MDPSLLAGRYRRTRLLGRGAMGEVWLAQDELLHRTVAVKSVLASESSDALERIVREARLAARLNHPNAVAVHDLVVEDGRPHVVMEYVAGRSLAEEIRGGALPPERVRTIGAAVADALAEAHALGIVHRDVKPANVLVSDRGVPKLADFGIARSTSAPGGTATGIMVGTPAFVAPEIVHGARADARSDVWSLGATLYTALEGRSPFQHTANDNVFAVLHRVVSGDIPTPRGDSSTAATVLRLMQADPGQRPTAGEVATSLREPGWAAPTQPVPVPARRTMSRGRLLIAVLVVVLLAAGLATGIVLAAGNSSSNEAGRSGPSRSSSGSSGGSSSGSDAAAVAYTAPGGITVRAPAGWIPDATAGIVNVRDYRAPGTTDRSTGTYFRIGIANTRPADTIADEGRGAQRYLEGEDNPNRARLVRTSTLTFLGVPAIDQEYVGTNAAGVTRRFVLRLWVVSGHTLEIEVNAPQDRFAAATDLFDQLVATCRVT